MKTLIYLMTPLILSVGALAQQQITGEPVHVDAATSASARAAVTKLGVEMIKGNHKYGLERMYPRWKRRLAKRNGGMQALDAKLQQAAQQKIGMNLRVTQHNAGEPTAFFSVWKAKKIDPKTGVAVLDAAGNPVIVDHWLAIVPTVTRVKVPDPQQGGRIRTLEESSYTIAISEKGKNDWYFMTGMKPTINDLRSLFPTLPATAKALRLPKGSAREIK